jgi:hypothetical protein
MARVYQGIKGKGRNRDAPEHKERQPIQLKMNISRATKRIIHPKDCSMIEAEEYILRAVAKRISCYGDRRLNESR